MSTHCKQPEWLTVSAAAKKLSRITNEEVEESDVYRFALDGLLKLSVIFVNHAKARRGRFIGYENSSWCELSPEMSARMSNTHAQYNKEQKLCTMTTNIPIGQKLPCKKSLKIGDDISITLDQEVITIKEISDLPMIGSERRDIENLYQQITGGPFVTLHEGVEGAFIETKDGAICQLQDHRDRDENLLGSGAQLGILKERIEKENITEPEAQILLDNFMQQRRILTSYFFSQEEYKCYFAARSLPKDKVLVVRTEALKAYLDSMQYLPASKETTSQRCERIKKRVAEEKGKGTKAFLKVVAAEENISVARIKQIIGRKATAKDSINNSTWEGLLASKSQTSSKKYEPKY